MIKCENMIPEAKGDVYLTIGPELVTLLGFIYDNLRCKVGDEEAGNFIKGCAKCALLEGTEDTSVLDAVLIANGITEPADVARFFGFCQE